MMNESIKEPIRSLSEWKNKLFPNGGEHDLHNEIDTSPIVLATKWAKRAIVSLPNKPTKPTK